MNWEKTRHITSSSVHPNLHSMLNMVYRVSHGKRTHIFGIQTFETRRKGDSSGAYVVDLSDLRTEGENRGKRREKRVSQRRARR